MKKGSFVRGVVLLLMTLSMLVACQMPAENNNGDSDGNKGNNSSNSNNNNGPDNTDNSGDITTPVVVKKVPLPEVRVVNQAAVDALQTYPEVELFCGENGVSAGADIFYSILQGPYTPGDPTADLVEKKYSGGKLPEQFDDITIFVRAVKKGFKNSDTVNYYFPRLTSPELGISWNKRGAATNISDTTIDEVAVVKSEGTFHLWYSKNGSIHYASSLDGLTWNNSLTAPVLTADHRLDSLDSDGVRVGAVIYDEEDRVYKMWYRGEKGGVSRIFHAVAKQAAGPWTKYPNDKVNPNGLPLPVLESGPDYEFDKEGLGDLAVIKELYYDGISYFPFYKMLYTGKGGNVEFPSVNRLHYAGSSNGIDWNKVYYPAAAPPQGKSYNYTWDRPQLVVTIENNQTTYKLWYLGGESSLNFGTASSPTCKKFRYYSPDHANLTKAPANMKDMAIIKDGLIYKMWYVHRGSDGLDKISYVESH